MAKKDSNDGIIVVVVHEDGTVGIPVWPEAEDSYDTLEKAEKAAKRLRKLPGYSWTGARVEVRMLVGGKIAARCK